MLPHKCDIKDKIEGAVHRAEEKGRHELDAIEHYIQKKPAQSVLAAFVAGIFVSALLGRR